MTDDIDFETAFDFQKGKPDALKNSEDVIEKGDLCHFRLFDEGEELFRNGKRGAEAYVIKSGKVRITRQVDGEEKEVGTVGAGEIVGEMAVISDMPRMATATAVEETLTVALSRRAVKIMLARTDFETRTLIDFLIARVQDHAAGEQIDADELRRKNRILELLLASPEMLEKLNSIEPFFVLLCQSLLKRAKRVLEHTDT